MRPRYSGKWRSERDSQISPKFRHNFLISPQKNHTIHTLRCLKYCENVFPQCWQIQILTSSPSHLLSGKLKWGRGDIPRSYLIWLSIFFKIKVESILGPLLQIQVKYPRWIYRGGSDPSSSPRKKITCVNIGFPLKNREKKNWSKKNKCEPGGLFTLGEKKGGSKSFFPRKKLGEIEYSAGLSANILFSFWELLKLDKQWWPSFGKSPHTHSPAVDIKKV